MQGAFLPASSAAVPTFLAMALAWSSFTDTGTETLAIEESGGPTTSVLNRSWWWWVNPADEPSSLMKRKF